MRLTFASCSIFVIAARARGFAAAALSRSSRTWYFVVELPAEAVFCSAATTGFDDAVAATGTAARASTATTIFTRRPMDRSYSDPGVVQSGDRRCYAC